MELIDRQALMTKLHRMPIFEKTDSDKKKLYVEKSIIDQMPTVDAEVVVRCKDCKHHDRCEMEDLMIYVDCIENPYCAAGERSEGE